MSEVDNQEQHEAVVANEPAPVVEPVTDPVSSPNAMDPVEEVPATQRAFKGSPEAGLQRIKAAIALLETHSAAKVAGSLISQALYELEVGYSVLLEHHPTNA